MELLERFEWDELKAERNLLKHGVTFEEAATVFSDPFKLVRSDERHSADEEREILVGHSLKYRVLVVAYVERERTRIISARKASPAERREYEQNYKC